MQFHILTKVDIYDIIKLAISQKYIEYEARSSDSSHSCYVTVVGYWTGSSESNGVNSYYDEETDTTHIYTVSSSYSVN